MSLIEGVTTRRKPYRQATGSTGNLVKRLRDSLLYAVTHSCPKGGREIAKPGEHIGSDFGKHQVILHRYMRSSVVLCLDPDYWAVRYLRGFQKRKLAKTGDGEKYQIITEWALVARNNLANSKIVAIQA